LCVGSVAIGIGVGLLTANPLLGAMAAGAASNLFDYGARGLLHGEQLSWSGAFQSAALGAAIGAGTLGVFKLVAFGTRLMGKTIQFAFRSGKTLASAVNRIGGASEITFLSGRARGNILNYLSQLTKAQLIAARQEAIDILERGTQSSRELASRLRAKGLHLRFENLEEDVYGRFTSGHNRILVNAKLVANHNIDEIAITIVHESQHLADDVAGRLMGFSTTRAELRAHSQRLFFEWAIGRGHLFNSYEQGGYSGLRRLIVRNYPSLDL
jgi:hypothetical protein